MTEARRHDPKVDVPNGYQHRFAEVNGIRILFVAEWAEPGD